MSDLVCGDAVELRQQSYPVLLFDQDSLQSLLVLLHLDHIKTLPLLIKEVNTVKH